MNQLPSQEKLSETSTLWDKKYQVVVCEHCDWSYLVPLNKTLNHCPYCYKPGLTTLQEEVTELPVTQPAELQIPFQLTKARIEQTLEDFCEKIPFPPSDLTTRELLGRLIPLYLPMWLVDAEVQANWKGEAGFDYQVISHQAHYNENSSGWSSREVKEGRIRWEPRLGTLTRSYQNIPAPALEEHAVIEKKLGGYDLIYSQEFQPKLIQDCLIRLPNRSTQDAWSDAQPAFQDAASEECRQAAAADHIRQFSWQPSFHNHHWTLLLLPLYSTFYLDDAQNPIAVLINGQNGKVNGIRRASMKRAQRASLIILSVASVIFLLGLIFSVASMLYPPTLVIGVIGLAIALLVAAAAILPLLNVWWFNRQK